MQCSCCKKPIVNKEYYSYNYPRAQRICCLCRPFEPGDIIFQRFGYYYGPNEEFRVFVEEKQLIRRGEITQGLDQLLIAPLTQIISTYDGSV